jgi:hypothetical protein
MSPRVLASHFPNRRKTIVANDNQITQEAISLNEFIVSETVNVVRKKFL